MRTFKENEIEMENASRRDGESEEHVKQLTMDQQIWLKAMKLWYIQQSHKIFY